MTSHYLGSAFVYFAIGRPAVVIAILIERAGFMPQIPLSLSEINWGPTTPEDSVVEPGNQCELARSSSLRQNTLFFTVRQIFLTASSLLSQCNANMQTTLK